MPNQTQISASFTTMAAARRDTHAGTIIQSMLLIMMDGVDEFQKKILNFPMPNEPRLLNESRHEFRRKFLLEEIDEYDKAYREGDIEGVVDGLVDNIYVALGELLEMGVEPMAAFDPVQSANMAKVRGQTKRGDSCDAVKPEGWTPPDHAAVLADLVLRSKVPPAFLEATKICLERAAKYNQGTVRREDHFPLGDASFMQMLWVKAIRLRSDVESGAKPDRDHLIDIMNYANFWVNHLDGRPL